MVKTLHMFNAVRRRVSGVQAMLRGASRPR